MNDVLLVEKAAPSVGMHVDAPQGLSSLATPATHAPSRCRISSRYRHVSAPLRGACQFSHASPWPAPLDSPFARTCAASPPSAPSAVRLQWPLHPVRHPSWREDLPLPHSHGAPPCVSKPDPFRRAVAPAWRQWQRARARRFQPQHADVPSSACEIAIKPHLSNRAAHIVELSPCKLTLQVSLSGSTVAAGGVRQHLSAFCCWLATPAVLAAASALHAFIQSINYI